MRLHETPATATNPIGNDLFHERGRMYWLDRLRDTTQVLRRLEQLEDRMATIVDVTAELSQVTEVAADLEAIRTEVAGYDETTAAKLDAPIARLRALAADPDEPVPPVEPPAE
jgi:hypothetical protein